MNKRLLAGILTSLTMVACAPVGLNPNAQAPLNPVRQQSLTATPTAGSQRQQTRADVQIFSQPQPVSVEANRLIFEGTQLNIKPNQVLMGRSISNQDFLRRVRRVQPSGNRLIVETTPATLFEAFEELDYVGAQIVRAPERISLSSHRFNIGGVVDIVLDMGLKPDFTDARLRVKDSRLLVRVAPTFDLDAKLRSEYRFLNTHTIADNLPIKPVGKVSFEALRVPAWIGPVPLVFHLKPGAGLDWGHRAEGKLMVGTQVNGQFKAAVEMEAGLNEAPNSQTDSSYRFDGSMLPPELQINGTARARLHLPTIHLDTEIAGLVGPFIEAGPYVDGNFTRRLTVTPKQTTVFTSVNSQLGLTIDGGITPTRLFGKDLSREVRIRILDKRIKELYRKEGTDVLPNASGSR